MEKMELIKPGIYKKTVRGQKFNNSIKNKYHHLQERIENLREIKAPEKVLKEPTLRPKLRQSMLLRAFKKGEKNPISSTPYHKATPQFSSSVLISPIIHNKQSNSSSNSSSSEVICASFKKRAKETSNQQDSSLIYMGMQESQQKEDPILSARKRKDVTPNRHKNNSKFQANKTHSSPPPPDPKLQQHKTSKIPVRKPSQEEHNNISELRVILPSLEVRKHLTRLSCSASLSSSKNKDEPVRSKSFVSISPRRSQRHQQSDSFKMIRHENINHSVNAYKAGIDHSKNKSTMVEENLQLSPDHGSVKDGTMFVNKTPRSNKRDNVTEDRTMFVNKTPRSSKHNNVAEDHTMFVNKTPRSNRRDNVTGNRTMFVNKTPRSKKRDDVTVDRTMFVNLTPRSKKDDGIAEDRTMFVNKTPRSQKRGDVDKVKDVVANDKENEDDQREGLMVFTKSLGLSPIDFDSQEKNPETKDMPRTPKAQQLSKSLADKREGLHKTVENIRQQMTKETQITPISKLPGKKTTKARSHLKMPRVRALATDQMTQTSMGNRETNSKMSPNSTKSDQSTGAASNVLYNAYDNNSECPNIYDSLLEGNHLHLDFSDSELPYYSTSMPGKPWRLNFDQASNDNCDSVKLNFLRTENQIRASLLHDNFSDDSNSSFFDMTLTNEPSRIKKVSNGKRTQTGKKQYANRSRKSVFSISHFRKSGSNFRNRKSLVKAGPNSSTKSVRKSQKTVSSESGVDTDAAVVDTRKPSGGSASSTDAEHVAVLISSADSKLLGVKLLANDSKKSKTNRSKDNQLENQQKSMRTDKSLNRSNIATKSVPVDNRLNTTATKRVLEPTSEAEDLPISYLPDPTPRSGMKQSDKSGNKQQSIRKKRDESLNQTPISRRVSVENSPRISPAKKRRSENIDQLEKNVSTGDVSKRMSNNKLDKNRNKNPSFRNSSSNDLNRTLVPVESSPNMSLPNRLRSKNVKDQLENHVAVSVSSSDSRLIGAKPLVDASETERQNASSSNILNQSTRKGSNSNAVKDSPRSSNHVNENNSKPTRKPPKNKGKQSREVQNLKVPNILINDNGRPKRERRPVRYFTDIIVTDAMKIPTWRENRISTLNKSQRSNGSRKTRTKKSRKDEEMSTDGDRGIHQVQPNLDVVQEDEPQENSVSQLVVEHDEPTATKGRRQGKSEVKSRTNGKKRSRKQDAINKTNENTVPAKEPVDAHSKLNDVEEESQVPDVPDVEVFFDKPQTGADVSRNFTELPSHENLDDIQHMDNEMMPPPRNCDTTSLGKTLRNGRTINVDSGFMTAKKNKTTFDADSRLMDGNSSMTLPKDPSLTGVKGGGVFKTHKKGNSAKTVVERVGRALEHFSTSTSLQHDSALASQQNTTNQSRRLTAVELINDDYITYMSNNTLCSIKYLNRVPLDSEYKTFENLHVKEPVKDPGSNCSSGYIRLDPGDQKRPNIATKYSFFYNIISGTASIQLHNRTNTVYQGDFFVVPLGIEYSIRNISKDSSLILFYVKVKGN